MEAGDWFNDVLCREWMTKETDASLLRNVPPDRLVEFQAQVRPLSDGAAADVRERLFRA